MAIFHFEYFYYQFWHQCGICRANSILERYIICARPHHFCCMVYSGSGCTCIHSYITNIPDYGIKIIIVVATAKYNGEWRILNRCILRIKRQCSLIICPIEHYRPTISFAVYVSFINQLDFFNLHFAI